VGKSSLLNALTRARPKIGDYAFTTQHPHVGIVEYEDFLQLSIADLPGLLPDMSFGKNFLYHLEKCKIILYVIDITRNNPLEQYNDMRNILLNFDNNFLINKPSILIANKIDVLEKIDPSGLKRILDDLKLHSNQIVAPVSALNKINLKKFLRIFRDLIMKNKIYLN
jgi:GTP-binding protein